MRLSQIGNVFSKFSFQLPKPAPVVIFDNAGSDTLRQFSLKEIDSVVVFTRFEKFYVNPILIVLILRRVISLIILRTITGFKLRKSDILTAYYWAQLDIIKPKVVITFIDTVSNFYRLCRIDKSATYIAVQNGNRWHLVESMTRAEIPHFFCFGHFEVNEYKRHLHNVDFFYPVGSIKGDYIGRTKEQSSKFHNHEILFVSQWRRSIMLEGSNEPLKKALQILEQFLLQYCHARKIKMAVACGGSTEEEIKYFKDFFGETAVVCPNVKSEFTTYRLMQAAKLVVTNWSTAGIESFGWGKKTFFCNFTGDFKNGFPTAGNWSISQIDFELFCEKMDFLRSESDFEFLENSKEARALHMNYPAGNKSTGEIVRDAIVCAIKNNGNSLSKPLIINEL